MDDYWLKQTINKPLFNDLIWSKPENKLHAGKLLIVGGSTNGFAHTVGCYMAAIKAGAGVVKVLIPESTKKIIGHSNEDIIFGAATHSGGFSQESLAELNELAEWSDGVLLSGEMGNNSDTTILFEKFFEKYSDTLVIAKDAFELSQSFLDQLLTKRYCTFMLDISSLQKLSAHTKLTKPILSNIALVNLVEALHEITDKNEVSLVVEHDNFLFVASSGYVSTTKLENKNDIQINLASNVTVWNLQNKTKTFEALSCAAITSQSTA